MALVQVEVGVLGECVVRVDGELVDIGHVRRQHVLVVLAVEVNRRVTVEQLVDRVWGDSAPPGVKSTLYSYLSRLRRHLGDQVERRSGGYVLTMDPLAVDLHRFQHLVRQARDCADQGQARELFAAALGLWRGEPFPGLDNPWFAEVRAAAERDRLAAELDYLDLRLANGEHSALLSDLDALAAAHPLDERIVGQVMLALFRCGRQADALERYHQIRLRLGEETGVEPGSLLQQLYQQILRGEAGLPKQAVRQLPHNVAHFTGRATEVADVEKRLTTDAAVIIEAIDGMAGVGKTALALQVAHRIADRFPDGQLYLDLHGFAPFPPMTASEALGQFLRSLGAPAERAAASAQEQAATYRSLLAGKRMLIVLDNARTADQVRPLLPGTPGCAVLVTSRNRLTSLVATDGASLVTLDVLAPTDALALLSEVLGEDRPRDGADELVRRCAYLPLALRIAAAYLATTPSATIADLCRQLAENRLSTLAAADDPHTAVRAAFDLSYNTLEPETQRVFRLLGLIPGPDFDIHAVAALTGMPEPQHQLNQLRAAHLVEQPDRFRLHDLLRDYAAQQAGQDDAAGRRLLDYYLHTALAADRILAPYRETIAVEPANTARIFTDYDEAMTWFTAEHTNLLAAIDHAAKHKWHYYAQKLPWALRTFHYRRGYWQDLLAAQHIALKAAETQGDIAGQAVARRYLGRAHGWLGHDEEALAELHAALALYGDDRAGQARMHHELAIVLEKQGDFAGALDHGQRSLDGFRAIGDQVGETESLTIVAWFHTLLGQHDKALERCHEARPALRDLGMRFGEAALLDTMAHAYQNLGQSDQALEHYGQALALFRGLGSAYYEAATLTSIGVIHQTAGDPTAAREAWERALAVFEDLGHAMAETVQAHLDAM